MPKYSDKANVFISRVSWLESLCCEQEPIYFFHVQRAVYFMLKDLASGRGQDIHNCNKCSDFVSNGDMLNMKFSDSDKLIMNMLDNVFFDTVSSGDRFQVIFDTNSFSLYDTVADFFGKVKEAYFHETGSASGIRELQFS